MRTIICLVAILSVAHAERRRISSPVAFYDDADVAPPGAMIVGESFGYTRVVGGRDIAFPSNYFTLGVHHRVDVSGDVPMVRSQFEHSRINAVGDAYFGTKIVVVPEGRRRPALAVRPAVEVLGRPSTADNPLAPDRINFVIPVVAQKSFEQYRLAYMAGYVTRGILFHSLSGEWNRWSRITPGAVVSASRLTYDFDRISQLGLNRSRLDVAGGMSVAVTPKCSVFANAGRSLGRQDLNSTRYQVTAGISFNMRLWGGGR